MQHEILSSHPLLGEGGELCEAGYAKSLKLTYDRSAIKASAMRIKEWDYYLISNGRYAVALTVADNSYMTLAGISFLDFEAVSQTTRNRIKWFSMGKTGMPSTSEDGSVSLTGTGYSLCFENKGGERRLYFRMERFIGKDAISGEFQLSAPQGDSVVVATPFRESKKAFYYNQKINNIRAQGDVQIGEREIVFSQGDTFATLDWGRGVWPYKNTWYWASLSCEIGGTPFGLNLGYGFGNNAAASENMIFWGGKGHKTEGIRFHIPRRQDGGEDYMSDWLFTSDDSRIHLAFTPLIDRKSKTNALVLLSDQHQVFGYFSGTAVLDTGETIRIENKLGFAEKVVNKW